MSSDRKDSVVFWENRYQTTNTPWDRGETSPALLQWLDSGELAPCRVLVPGCGRGYEVVELARRGFEVVALDFAPSAVRHLQEVLALKGLTGEVLEADVLVWTPLRPFDAIYEQTCLCALPPGAWAAYGARLRDWLRPEGLLFALFMQTGREGGPPFHCDMEAMRALFSPDQWEWSGAPFCEVPHPAGIHELSSVLRRLP